MNDICGSSFNSLATAVAARGFSNSSIDMHVWGNRFILFIYIMVVNNRCITLKLFKRLNPAQ